MFYFMLCVMLLCSEDGWLSVYLKQNCRNSFRPFIKYATQGWGQGRAQTALGVIGNIAFHPGKNKG